MNGWMKIAAISTAAMLAACDGQEATNSDTQVSDPMAENTLEKDTMESTQQVVLETESLKEFKTSLAFMRASLTEENRVELTEALARLSGMEGKQETADSPDGRDVIVDPVLAEAVYNKYGTQLDGKTFDDVVAMAG